jgi:hypothetical protein
MGLLIVLQFVVPIALAGFLVDREFHNAEKTQLAVIATAAVNIPLVALAIWYHWLLGFPAAFLGYCIGCIGSFDYLHKQQKHNHEEWDKQRLATIEDERRRAEEEAAWRERNMAERRQQEEERQKREALKFGDAVFEGVHICAEQGKGKTTLLKYLFMQHIHENASIIILDAKGDLLNPIRRLKWFAKGEALEDRITVLDPDITDPVGLNPFQLADTANLSATERDTFRTFTIELLEYVFGGMMEDYKFTPTQSICFVKAIDACLASDKPTFKTFRDILNGKADYLLPRLDEEQRRFITEELKGHYIKTRSEINARLDYILTRYKTFAAMLAAPTTTFNIGEQMNRGQVVLINTNRGILGQGATVFGRLIIAMIRAAATQRHAIPAEQRTPVYVYLDEAHDYCRGDKHIHEIIDQCRSFKIGLILAHQRLGQLGDNEVAEAVGNCQVKIANHEQNAPQLYKRFRLDSPEQLDLPPRVFAVRVRNKPTAFTAEIPFVDIPQMEEHEHAELTQRMKEKYAYRPEPTPPPAELAIGADRNPDTVTRKRGKKL